MMRFFRFTMRPVALQIALMICLTMGVIDCAVAAAVMRSESRTVPVGPCHGLMIRNSLGQLEIRGEDREDVFIDIQFRVRGKKEEEIKAISDRLSLVVEPEGGWLRLSPRYAGKDIRVQDPVFHKIKIYSDIKVRLPRDFNVDASIVRGDMTVQDMDGDILLNGTSGDVEAQRLQGRFELKLTSGNLEAEDIGDEVAIVVTSGRIRLRRIDGNVRIKSDSGGLVANDLASNLIVQTESGDVNVERVTGDLSLVSIFGEIYIDSPGGQVQARTSNGDITVIGVGGPGQSCHLTSSSGDVEVFLTKEADYQVDLSTSSGAIHWKLPLEVHSVSRQALLGLLGEGMDTFHIVTASGDMRISPTED
ncbi:MAG: DUF4097 domain-containing protein [bacterium]|nr:DUF4097 domain-containing protein [bacterium]